MSASIIGVLLAFIKIAETFLSFKKRRDDKRQTNHAILTLQNYRKSLEQALLARRQSAIAHRDSDHADGWADRLPDDGYRRD